PIWLASLYFLIESMGGEQARPVALRRAFLSGLLFGAALLCSQKVGFALAGVAGIYVSFALHRRRHSAPGAGEELLVWCVGTALPIAMAVGYFVSMRSASDFGKWVVVEALKVRSQLPRTKYLWVLVEQNPMAVALMSGGVVHSAYSLSREWNWAT